MYLRETRRTNRDGSVVRYLQLEHNQRHPETGNSVAKVIHNFGRAEKVDRDALGRLVSSISRFLTPEQAISAAGAEVEILDSRPLGGAWTLDRVWERLGIGAAIRRVAEGRRLDGEATERVLYALVAQRALEPGSKLAGTRWVGDRVAIDGCPGFSDDAAYAAMDFLLEALDEIAGEIFGSVATLLNLDLDLVFVDTTSTYWEVDGADDLAGWNLPRLVWVADRGFASAANRAYLTRGGGHYIHAEKLRHSNAEATAALARAGRYKTVADNLRVKEVAVAPGGDGDGDGGARAQRFVVCHNPEQADRDAAVRDRLVAHLEELIAGSDAWSGRRRDEFVGSLKGKPGLRTSDVTLTPEDLAAAYKQLLAVERGWRDLKGALGLRPVFHHREDRIRGHVQLCWLALLLIRVVENATGDTWRNTRHELDRMHL